MLLFVEVPRSRARDAGILTDTLRHVEGASSQLSGVVVGFAGAQDLQRGDLDREVLRERVVMHDGS